MTPHISIRLVLYTEWGAAGPRLERAMPLPTYDFNFEDTEEGRERAERAKQQLQQYVDKYHIPRSKKF